MPESNSQFGIKVFGEKIDERVIKHSEWAQILHTVIDYNENCICGPHLQTKLKIIDAMTKLNVV